MVPSHPHRPCLGGGVGIAAVLQSPLSNCISSIPYDVHHTCQPAEQCRPAILSIMEVLDGGRAWFKCPGPKGMVLGEAPIYRPQDTTLHWVNCLSDPPEIHILQLDPNTGNPTSSTKDAHRILPLTDSVSVAFFRKDKPGSYICAYHQGIAFLDERSGALEVVKEIIPTADREIRRFNDGGIDAKGRFWLAEIDRKAMAYGPRNLPADYGEPIGRLWRYEPDGSLHQMETGIVCGNGLAWSPDNKTMYFNDSVSLVMYAYDFDLETGNISSKRIFIDRRQTYGEPDGMVVE